MPPDSEITVDVDLRALIQAGAHFGHRKRFRHPSFSKYLHGMRNGLHIINLDETKRGLIQAARVCATVASSGKKILYVCTRHAGTELIQQEADRAGMPYVNHRWLGGLLSNFDTVLKSVRKLEDYENLIKPDSLKRMTKKEGLRLIAKLRKLEQNLGGVRELSSLPAALFVVDAGHHRIAIREAKRIGIPVIAVIDSNHSIEDVDVVIPGNDDSTQCISIYTKIITDAILAGKKLHVPAPPPVETARSKPGRRPVRGARAAAS